VSFRVFEFAARDAGVTAAESSSCGIHAALRVLCPPPYRRYWFSDPVMPLVVTPAVRFSGGELGWSQSRHQRNPLFAFQLPLEFCPANPRPQAAARRLLSWTLVPFSTSGFGGPLTAGVPRPATFHLQGLSTLLVVYSLRARAGFVSCRQRSWDSPFGAFSSRKVSRAFPPESTHLPFSLRIFLPRKAAGRHRRPRFLGFAPSESPVADRCVLSTPAAGGSPGFRPSRVCWRRPWPGFRPTSSLALSGHKRP